MHDLRSFCVILFLLALTGDRSNAQEWQTRARVFLRSDSLYKSKPIRLLPRDEKVTILREMSDITGYAKIRSADGEEGWICMDYLRPASNGGTETAFARSVPCGGHCGVQRWPVKTATDGDAGQINEREISATIAQLRTIAAPRQKPQNSRVGSTERTTFVVNAFLIGWKLENDNDLHLVIADKRKNGKRMIAEVPDLQCQLACQSKYKSRFRQVRDMIVATLGNPPATYRTLSPPRPITIKGVGFFDFIHGQKGVAPNGIELHPVLDIQFR